MSLISEALKKARQEVARQDADRIGGVPPALPRHMPLARRDRPTWLPAAAGGFAGAAVVTALLLVAFRPGETAPARERMVAPSPIPTPSSIPTPSPLPTAPPPVGTVPPAGATVTLAEIELPAVLAATRPAPAVETPLPVAPATPRPSPRAPAPAATAAPPVASPGPATTSALPPAVAVVPAADGEAAAEPPPYRVRLPDGKELVLRGIAAGEGPPVALINRSAVGIGERVDGWTVARIEPKRVELVRGGETVVLSLRR